MRQVRKGNEKRLKLAVILSIRYIVPATPRNQIGFRASARLRIHEPRMVHFPQGEIFFEPNPLPGASHVCTLMQSEWDGELSGGTRYEDLR